MGLERGRFLFFCFNSHLINVYLTTLYLFTLKGTMVD